jgi:beta-N-acetylglucosaminidase
MRVVETATKEEIGAKTIKAKFTWTTEEVQKALDEVYFELCDEHLDDSFRDITTNKENSEETNTNTDSKSKSNQKFNPYDFSQLYRYSGIDKSEVRNILNNYLNRQ